MTPSTGLLPPLDRRPQAALRSGISLLEVLISIGILAVGLTAALSLLPAGRTYMKKAAVDDRAAALVPNAFATLQNLGLFRKDALTWTDDFRATATDTENASSDPVIRVQKGADVFANGSNGRTQDAGWKIISIDSEMISTFYDKNLPPTNLRGTVPPVTDPEEPAIPVTITSAPPVGPGGTEIADRATGAWSRVIPRQPLPLPPESEDMQIETSGPNVGKVKNQPFVDYTFTATYTLSGSVQSTSVTPGSYRQLGRLRESDHRVGKAVTTYELPGNATRNNETAQGATKLSLPRLINSTSQMRGAIARQATMVVNGHLWRMQLGTRRGDYERFVLFANALDAPPNPQSPNYKDKFDIIWNVGKVWVDRNNSPKDPNEPDSVPEDQDWFVFDVEASQIVEISYVSESPLEPVGAGGGFPLYFNSTAQQLTPFESDAVNNVYKYSIPADGMVITRAQLRTVRPASELEIPLLQNTFGAESTAIDSRRNPGYTLTIVVKRSERAIVIDPLMATKLDKVIVLGNKSGIHDPYVIRRARFADFQQQFAGNGTPRAFVIPRLNWQRFASGNIDTMLAMAERLFRDEDNMAVDPPASNDEAPGPLFDLTSAQTPMRRQATGRMSWILMVQPEDPGPVAMNWEAGRYFDVSMVIFEDRKLPPADANAAIEGEYAFEANWSDRTGLVTVTVPFDVNKDGEADLVGDDVRGLFKAGGWVLLAPRVTYSASLIDDQQRLDWIKIRSAEFENTGTGMVASLLLEAEPNQSVLMRSLNMGTDCPLVVMTYDGVVAVVRKTMRLEP